MRKIILVLFLTAGVCASAYQTGSVSRPKFTNAPAAATAENQDKAKEEKPAAPGQQTAQTRSFTSYSSRPGNAWRQGVQTQTVQTQTATQAAQPKNEQAIKDKMIQRNQVGQQTKDASKEKNASGKKAAAEAAAPAAKEEDASKNGKGRYLGSITFKKEQAPAVADMLQSMMGGMQGGKGGTGGGAAPAGMPDMSALMNMAGQGGAGKK